jgi:sulfur transfer complex TusBCD TusB component (DsrH family)
VVTAGRALHIVRRRADETAWAVIAAQNRESGVDVVLVQDGVFAEPPDGTTVWVNDDDVAARGIETPHRRVGYDELAGMVVNAATVRVW